MTDPHAESIAFREALLKSEHLRIRIVLGAILAAFLLRTIRGISLGGGHENFVSWLMMFGLLGLFVIFEFLMLRAVNRAIEGARLLPNWMWLSSILLESLLPDLPQPWWQGRSESKSMPHSERQKCDVEWIT